MKASRLLSLPPYLFEDLENRYNDAVGAGRDVIDLSIGDPDLAPPAELLSALTRALGNAEHHRYPPQRGTAVLKGAIRRYLDRRCGLAPEDNQILVLVGSKEGIAHLPWALCNPGDVALIPNPGYPVYHSSAQFAGCRLVEMPLEERSGFVPDFDAVMAAGDNPRLCFINYPNNPTTATAPEALFQRALALCDDRGTVVMNDAAYADVYLDEEPPMLLTQLPGALDRPIVEMFSFSKTYSITGWRVGFAVGRPDIIEALAHMKANIDSSQFGAIQEAVARTLDGEGDAYTGRMRAEYGARRDLVVERLEKLGFHCFRSCATFYVWCRVPQPWAAMDYALHMLERADVLLTPGTGFGSGGEGFFRIALTQSLERLDEAMDRIERL